MNKNEKFYEELDEFEIPEEPDLGPELNFPYTSQEIIEIKKRAKQNIPQVLLTINNLEKKSTSDPNATFKDLYKLLYDPELLAHSLGTIMKRTGSLSLGIDELSTDSTNYKTIIKLSDDLKANNFKYKPIRRIFIDKTSKDPNINKKATRLYKENQLSKEKIKELKIRPLGILTTKDKIIAESTRIILNAIFEPQFKKLNLNFGFRPGLGCQNAIDSHVTKAKAHKFAIEADITGAFDNVDHDILMQILSQKIKDQRFLKIIKDGLQAGIFFAGNIEDQKIGTTQGSNISPLLYNIYFNEFDKFIATEFTEYIENLNIEQNRIDEPKNYRYVRITKDKAKLKKQLTELNKNLNRIYEEANKNITSEKTSDKFLERLKMNKFIYEKYTEQLKTYKETYKLFRQLDLQQKITRRLTPRRTTIRFTYTRYADDWIFTTNASEEQTNQFKNIFTNWIKTKLKLDLSETKTKITPLTKGKEKIKFLGFKMAYFSEDAKNTRRTGMKRTHSTKKGKKKFKGTKFKLTAQATNTLRTTRKIATVSLIASMDKDRIFNRLIEARFIRKKLKQYYGRSKPEWSILEIPDIIERYNQIIRGYINYYAPILRYPSELGYLLYLFQYSCLHTLANKQNCRISQIIKKYGKYPEIKWQITLTKKKKNNIIITEIKERKTSLIDWEQASLIIAKMQTNFRTRKQTQNTQIPIDNIPTIKYNWRTKFKLTKHCSICGSTKEINYHHVRHIRIGKTTGFLQIMNQLNRKQIPVCIECHRNIHKGKYDSLKLADIYDERLIIL